MQSATLPPAPARPSLEHARPLRCRSASPKRWRTWKPSAPSASRVRAPAASCASSALLMLSTICHQGPLRATRRRLCVPRCKGALLRCCVRAPAGALLPSRGSCAEGVHCGRWPSWHLAAGLRVRTQECSCISRTHTQYGMRSAESRVVLRVAVRRLAHQAEWNNSGRRTPAAEQLRQLRLQQRHRDGVVVLDVAVARLGRKDKLTQVLSAPLVEAAWS